jgi:hypothetical protein
MPPARLTVEQRSLVDLTSEHFFQAESLRAELHFIAGVFLWPPSLVLDRERTPESWRIRQGDSCFGTTKLNYIRLADESEPE